MLTLTYMQLIGFCLLLVPLFIIFFLADEGEELAGVLVAAVVVYVYIGGSALLLFNAMPL